PLVYVAAPPAPSTLSLHDALPIYVGGFVAALAIAATIVDISPFSTNGAMLLANVHPAIRDRYYRQMIGYAGLMYLIGPGLAWVVDRKSTRLNSSHVSISYAVFCWK